MTTQRDLERALDDFFGAGVDEVADRVIDDALVTIDHTPQRRALRVPWRFPFMSSSLRLATTAVAVVLAVGALSAFILANRGGGGVGATPGPSVSVAPSSTPSPSPTTAQSPTASSTSTADWVPYTSTRYAYTIARPPTWRAASATRDWVFSTDVSDYLGPATDQFIDPAASYQILVTSFAADLAPGTTEDDWMSTYYHAIPDASCRANLAAMAVLTVDGHSGRLWTSTCSDSQAFVLVDNRIHVFSIWRGNQEPLLRAFLSTVKFQAGTPSGSPGVSPSPG